MSVDYFNFYKVIIVHHTSIVLNNRIVWPIEATPIFKKNGGESKGIKNSNSDYPLKIKVPTSKKVLSQLNKILVEKIPDKKKINNEEKEEEELYSPIPQTKKIKINPFQKIYIDIILETPQNLNHLKSNNNNNNNNNNKEKTKILLERWIIDSSSYIPTQEIEESEIGAALRRAIVVMRCLYSYSLLLPSYQVFRKYKKNRSVGFKLTYSMYTEKQKQKIEKEEKETKELKNNNSNNNKKILKFQSGHLTNFKFSPILNIQSSVQYLKNFNISKMFQQQKTKKINIIDDFYSNGNKNGKDRKEGKKTKDDKTKDDKTKGDKNNKNNNKNDNNQKNKPENDRTPKSIPIPIKKDPSYVPLPSGSSGQFKLSFSPLRSPLPLINDPENSTNASEKNTSNIEIDKDKKKIGDKDDISIDYPSSSDGFNSGNDNDNQFGKFSGFSSNLYIPGKGKKENDKKKINTNENGNTIGNENENENENKSDIIPNSKIDMTNFKNKENEENYSDPFFIEISKAPKELKHIKDDNGRSIANLIDDVNELVNIKRLMEFRN